MDKENVLSCFASVIAELQAVNVDSDKAAIERALQEAENLLSEARESLERD